MLRTFLETAAAALISLYVVCGAANAQVGWCAISGGSCHPAVEEAIGEFAEKPLRAPQIVHRCAGLASSMFWPTAAPADPHSGKTCCESMPGSSPAHTAAAAPPGSGSIAPLQSNPGTPKINPIPTLLIRLEDRLALTRAIPFYIQYQSLVC
jgi:hypothetical protein